MVSPDFCIHAACRCHPTPLPPSSNTGTAGAFFVTDGQTLGSILDSQERPKHRLVRSILRIEAILHLFSKSEPSLIKITA